MKKLPILLCVFLLSACAPSEVPYDKLLERNGLKYEINSQTGFTGVATVYYENGQLDTKATYKDEKPNGLNESYYENGQLHYKSTYKDGKRHGLSEDYTENGQVYPMCYKNGEKVDISRCKSL